MRGSGLAGSCINMMGRDHSWPRCGLIDTPRIGIHDLDDYSEEHRQFISISILVTLHDCVLPEIVRRFCEKNMERLADCGSMQSDKMYSVENNPDATRKK